MNRSTSTRRGLSLLFCGAVWIGCGGSTAPTAASRAGAATGPGSGAACTELGCVEGVDVLFTYRATGSYTIEVTIDGAKVTCKATLPLVRDDGPACDRADVTLGLVGSMLPVAQQYIENLHVASATVKSMSFRLTHDQTVKRIDAPFPVTYAMTPGPNGPSCEPKQCTHASFALPAID